MKIRHCSPDRRTRANQDRAQALAAGMEWGGHRWQIDPSSSSAIASRALRLLLDPSITTVTWTSQANVDVPLSRDQFLALAQAVDEHCEQLHRQCRRQKDPQPRTCGA